MHLLPHLAPTLLSLRQHWLTESMHLLPQGTCPEGQAVDEEEAADTNTSAQRYCSDITISGGSC